MAGNLRPRRANGCDGRQQSGVEVTGQRTGTGGTSSPSACATFGQELADFGNEIDRDLHRRVGRRFERRLVLGHGLLVRLRIVMREDAADALFIPMFRKIRRLHGFLRRLRRSAFNAFGPSSYAVMTNTESGSGSAT